MTLFTGKIAREGVCYEKSSPRMKRVLLSLNVERGSQQLVVVNASGFATHKVGGAVNVFVYVPASMSFPWQFGHSQNVNTLEERHGNEAWSLQYFTFYNRRLE